MRHRLFSRGFTIVELLVVIVVIGILASVVVVAYSGVQQRAYNAKVVSGVNAYPGAFQVAKAPATPPDFTIQKNDPGPYEGIQSIRYVACGASAVNAAGATGYYIGWYDYVSSAVKYYVGGTAVGAGGNGTNGNYTSITTCTNPSNA